MNNIAISLAVAFVIRQLEQYGSGTDWSKVKADLEPRVRKLVPGSLFDSQAVKVANKVIDTVALALQDATLLATIIGLLQAGDYKAAEKTVRNYIADASNDDFVKALLAA